MTINNASFLDFEEFSKAPIFRNLENIRAFTVAIYVPHVYQWISTPVAGNVLSRLYDECVRALKAAEFFSIDNLKPTLSQNNISVEYVDDNFGFKLTFDEDGDLYLFRNGSSFARFYEWYKRFMPSLESLVSRILEGLSEEVALGRSANSNFRPALTPVRASYHFQFVAYDFMQPPSTEVVRNSSILTRLVQSLPGESGHLQTVGDAMVEEFGRMDVKLNRWSKHPMGYCREVYSVEAPGNRRYSSVWFNFLYVGEGRNDGEEGRSEFNASSFLSQVELPIMEFLRQRAIEAFVGDVTKNYIFSTTPSSLP